MSWGCQSLGLLEPKHEHRLVIQGAITCRSALRESAVLDKEARFVSQSSPFIMGQPAPLSAGEHVCWQERSASLLTTLEGGGA